MPPPQLLLLLGQQSPQDLEVVFLSVDQLELLVEQVGALLEPPFLLAEVAADAIDLGVEILAPLEDFFLGGQRRPGLRIVSASTWALARICSASPRTVFARNRATRYALASPINTPEVARRNRSAKLLQAAERPDRERAASGDESAQEERARKGADADERLKRTALGLAMAARAPQSGTKYRKADRHRGRALALLLAGPVRGLCPPSS